MRRRMFLRGAGGVAVALPFLESLFGRRGTARAAGPGGNRLVVFFTCNGVNLETFFPQAPGPLTVDSLMGSALEPLTAYREKLLIPRGLHMVPKGWGHDPGTAGNDHAMGMGHKLTAQPLDPDTLYARGVSVDQFAAAQLNPDGRPSLTLSVGWRHLDVLGHISYAGSGMPVTPEGNPWLTYQDLMGLGGLDELAKLRIATRRQSVLDLVEDEFKALKARGLGKADAMKLEMHADSIRDLEVEMAGSGLVACALDPARAAEIEAVDPDSVLLDAQFKAIGRMQLDVLAMAIACGATNVATIQWASGSGGPVYQWDGMHHEYNHHKLSHGNTKDDDTGEEVAGYMEMLAQIDRWHAEQLGHLLDRLSAYEEGDGTVLDRSAVVWMHELSEGKIHSYIDLPTVIAGSAGGYLKQGEYIDLVGDEDPWDLRYPHNRLLVTLLNAVGCTGEDGSPITEFGREGLEKGEYSELLA
ncbi:DUF1552 domain-containing protein [Nannocystis punicea]|uniref:DUF1552 domain-containing protein n=1 Tax=Nannocystis punicea TaxID=2995304 RepID=A0ABY7GXQ4_9BACT|nr:DUF1552 domain-containing protein [Nannocystis poenicansa]WAS91599.1 DUF1552 domain-containing protein [Nannocystis poenicansa]